MSEAREVLAALEEGVTTAPFVCAERADRFLDMVGESILRIKGKTTRVSSTMKGLKEC